MLIKSKKGLGIQIFAFFFILMILSGLALFFSVGLHMLLYSYAIEPTVTTAGGLLNTSGQAYTYVTDTASDFYSFYGFYDILFLVIVLAAFIESIIAAVKSREAGILSVFGFITIGNIFLILLLNFAIQIRGWIVNDFFYTIITSPIDVPFMTFFYNYSYFIGILWYLAIIIANQINIPELVEKLDLSSIGFGKKRDGEFEE